MSQTPTANHPTGTPPTGNRPIVALLRAPKDPATKALIEAVTLPNLSQNQASV